MLFTRPITVPPAAAGNSLTQRHFGRTGKGHAAAQICRFGARTFDARSSCLSHMQTKCTDIGLLHASPSHRLLRIISLAHEFAELVWPSPFLGAMSDGSNNNLGPAAIVAAGLVALGVGVASAAGQVANAGGQIATALSAPGSPSDRLATAVEHGLGRGGPADRVAACVVDWTHDVSTPWPQKLLPMRRWTPRVPRPDIR